MSSFRKSVSGYRPVGGWVDGKWQQSKGISLLFFASVQPANGKDMQSLPENRRSAATYVLFSDTQLFTADVEKKTNADIVMLFGEEHEIVSVQPWQNHVINHYRYLAQRCSFKIPVDATLQ